MSVSGSRKNWSRSAAELEPCVVSLGTFLRRKHPRDTAASVEAETGIAAGTVEKWLCHASLPQARHMAVLIGVYGPSFLAALIPAAPRWLDDAVRAERLRDLEAQSAALAAERAALERQMGRVR